MPVRTKSFPTLPSADAWERQWRKHWSKLGAPGYELPLTDTADRELLNQTRTPEKEKARLKRINDEFVRAFKGLYRVGPAVTVFGSARFKETHRYYKLARVVGAELAKAGFATLTGGGPGIMEAANRGARDVGADTIGLNILLPHEQAPNPYVTPGLSMQFHYFALRKMHFLLHARAVAVFPGGFGTFDESFELLTLIQTGKIAPIPVLFYGKDFWSRVVDFEALVEEGVISPKDLDLFHFCETAEEGWRIVQDFWKGKDHTVIARPRPGIDKPE